MRRMAWAWITGSLVTVFLVSGCGNFMKKTEFTPEYEAYKSENESRLQAVDAAIADTHTQISQTESALRGQIQDSKEEVLAAVEQGDADTIEAARQMAAEMDSALRDEIQSAIKQASEQAVTQAKQADDAQTEEIMAALEQARNAVMSELGDVTSRSATDLEQFRAEIADALMRAVPVKVSTVFFGSGSATLQDSAKADLDEVVARIKENPNAVVKIVGHADSRPILSGRFLTNIQLSEARAKAVADYLTAQGVQNRIELSGRGHFETVGSQASADGQQMSRRVEVYLASE